MLNRINLQRIIANVCAILRQIDTEVIIYDHHVARGALFQERLSEVYDTASKEGRAFLTAAEWLGREPLVLALTKE
jgi:predicted metallo-beta-lactamase superfamily hydrolase